NCGFREDCELLAHVVAGLGGEGLQRPGGIFQRAPPPEGARGVGLFGQLSPRGGGKKLPVRVAPGPRGSHDRTIRQLCSTPAEQRARLLVALYGSLDPLIRPLALDEMGMSGQPECIPKLVDLIRDDGLAGFTRIKAIEAAGRLRASAASPL